MAMMASSNRERLEQEIVQLIYFIVEGRNFFFEKQDTLQILQMTFLTTSSQKSFLQPTGNWFNWN